METLLKTHKKIGFTSLDTVEIVTSMNKVLANYHVFYQKLRNFHWNVKGADFFDLHDKFEELYTSAVTNIDEIAERIRVFGQTPMSTLKEYLKVSEIQESGYDLTSIEMVMEVLNDIEILDRYFVDVAEIAEEIGDVATTDLINTMLKNIEKEHWMLSAWLNNAKK